MAFQRELIGLVGIVTFAPEGSGGRGPSEQLIHRGTAMCRRSVVQAVHMGRRDLDTLGEQGILDQFIRIAGVVVTDRRPVARAGRCLYLC